MKTFIVFLLVVMALPVSAIRPEREYKFTPALHGLKFSEYQVTTPDNLQINVWEYALPDGVESKRTIVMACTDAGNMGYFIYQAKAFIAKGIRVISFDYRGFGKSSDFEINKDYLYYSEFATDLDSVLRSTRAKYPKEKVGVLGLSMGSYIGLLAKEKIDFYLAEGFYCDPVKVSEAIFSSKGIKVILPGNAKAVSKLAAPAMIFCAGNDKVTIPQFAKDFAKTNKVTIVDFDGEHLYGLNVFTKDEPGDEYAAKVKEFLEGI